MMARSLTRVLVERERLRGRIEGQRREVARYGEGLARPAAIIDRVIQAGRFLRAHPLVVAAAGVAVFALRGRTMLGLATRGFAVWRLARRARALLRSAGY
ncbi:MAG: YqjK family protein [Burkholderiales bacterium]